MEESSKKRGKPLKWILLVVVTLAVLAAAAWFLAFRMNRFSLELELTGKPKLFFGRKLPVEFFCFRFVYKISVGRFINSRNPVKEALL